MSGILSYTKCAIWVLATALAAAAAGQANPAGAAMLHPRGPAMAEPAGNHGWLPAPLTVRADRTTRRAPEANEGTPRTPRSDAQTAIPAKWRDPFKAPEPPPAASNGKKKLSRLPAVLPPGVRGLLIDQLVLEGVVDKLPGNTMIAVVTNKTNRAYFLRVNEQVFDGAVTLITPEAIYFRQHYYADGDKAEWRTVEKRLTPGPEGSK